MNHLLFSPYKIGKVDLKNRIVMAPMTRSRATRNLPNDFMAQYYAQRATAGLIITEGTSPSVNGLGYSRIPGIFNGEQVTGWKKVTHSVHARDGKIFLQIMHTGRVGHPLNLPQNGRILGPSPIAAAGNMWTDEKGLQPMPVPDEMNEQDLFDATMEFVSSAVLAMDAGFDGVELHAANGYLLNQFMNPGANLRKDAWGGSISGMLKFPRNVVVQVAKAIGSDRVGVRISPFNPFNGMSIQSDGPVLAEFAKGMAQIGISYIHIINPGIRHEVEFKSLHKVIRGNFSGSIILAGGYDQSKAESALQENYADLVAFGKPFISNPRLVEKFRTGAPLIPADETAFYTPDTKGYLDYPEGL